MGLAVGGLASGWRLSAAEFWNNKEPMMWTEAEVRTLATKSPWAKEVRPNFKGRGRGRGPGDVPVDPTTQRPAMGNEGRGGPPAPVPIEMGRPQDNRSSRLGITVRWESAQPILDALKTPMSKDFEGHYVVSLSNLPDDAAGATSPEALDRLQNGATLESKGRTAVEAGVIHRTRSGEILLGFAKDVLPLTERDREITFSLDTEGWALKVKFDAKEMVYRGKLAV